MLHCILDAMRLFVFYKSSVLGGMSKHSITQYLNSCFVHAFYVAIFAPDKLFKIVQRIQLETHIVCVCVCLLFVGKLCFLESEFYAVFSPYKLLKKIQTHTFAFVCLLVCLFPNAFNVVSRLYVTILLNACTHRLMTA